MKRTKEWWGRLSKDERKELVYLEKTNKKTEKLISNYPPDVYECPACGNPTIFNDLCGSCWFTYDTLMRKANGGYYEYHR